MESHYSTAARLSELIKPCAARMRGDGEDDKMPRQEGAMVITGYVRKVDGKDVDEQSVKEGMRTSLTVGLAMLLEAVFEDGVRALAMIDAETERVGVGKVVERLNRNLSSFGKLKPNPRCGVLPLLGTAELHMLVGQTHMFRMLQVAIAAAG